jgi:hypothetical protein
MRHSVIGPPGAGVRAQSAKLAVEFRIPHLSASGLIRRAAEPPRVLDRVRMALGRLRAGTCLRCGEAMAEQLELAPEDPWCTECLLPRQREF